MSADKRLTKGDTLRLILTRIDEWDVNMDGQSFFDHQPVEVGRLADELLTKSPELALDHG